jgi:hypothetical protein
VPAEVAVVLAQTRLQLAAVLTAGVALRPVDTPAVPGEPPPGIGIHILAVAKIEKLTLERSLRLRVRPFIADLTPEDDRYGHVPHRSRS